MARSRRWRILAGLAVVGATGVGVFAAAVAARDEALVSVRGSASGAPARTQADGANSRFDELVERSVDQARGVLQDPVRVVGSTADSVVFVARDDFLESLRADLRQQFGQPYDADRLLAPATDERGRLVGYFAQGAGFIPADAVDDPGFDLCAIQRQKVDIIHQTPEGTVKSEPC